MARDSLIGRSSPSVQRNLIVGLLLLCPVPCALAQAPEASFADAMNLLRAGEGVRVERTSEARIAGTVVEATATALTISVDGRPIVLASTAVTEVAKVDSRWNGALIGAAAGVLPGVKIGQLSCGEGPEGTCRRGATAGGIIFAGIGAAIGAAIDGLINHQIYVAGRQARLALQPAMAPSRYSLSVALRF